MKYVHWQIRYGKIFSSATVQPPPTHPHKEKTDKMNNMTELQAKSKLSNIYIIGVSAKAGGDFQKSNDLKLL